MGNLEIITELVKAFANCALLDLQGNDPLEVARKAGHATCVSLLTKERKERPQRLGERLFEAAQRGQVKVINELVKRGAVIDAQDSLGRSPLYYAVSANQAACVRALLAAGYTISHIDKEGNNSAYAILSKDAPCALSDVSGRFGAYRELVKSGIDKNTQNIQGETLLHKAVAVQDYELVKELLAHSVKTDLPDRQGNTALHYAAEKDFTGNIISLLIRSGASVEISNKKGSSALDRAVTLRNKEGEKILRAELARIAAERLRSIVSAVTTNKPQLLKELLRIAPGLKDVGNKEGSTLLHLASEKGFLGCVRVLLEEGANTECFNADGFTPLHEAIGRNHENCVALLLAQGADKNARTRTETKNTPLQQAVLMGHIQCIKLLLNAGADKEAHDADGCTALHLAALYNSNELGLRLLVASGANINAIAQPCGNTALFLAIKKEHLNVFSTLLQLGADPEICDHDGWTLLHLAVYRNNDECVKLLLEKGANKNAQTLKEGFSSLHFAVQMQHLGCLKALLKKGARRNLLNHNGYTPLHLAVHLNYVEYVTRLCENGADMNAQTSSGQRPLHLALSLSHIDCFRALQSAGADLNAYDSNGFTPLHWAVWDNCQAEVALILSLGAHLEVPTSRGLTALRLAVEKNHENCLKLLLRAGADKEAPDSEGYTALHSAVSFGHEDCARQLIAKGANKEAQTLEGLTPLHIAVDKDNFSCVILLLKAGASRYPTDGRGRTPLDMTYNKSLYEPYFENSSYY